MKLYDNSIKKGALYRGMKRSRAKLTVISAVMLVLMIYYAVNISCYVYKIFNGATKLDTEKYFSETKIIELTNAYTTDKKNEDYAIKGYTFTNDSYWSDNRYYFEITPDSVEPEKLVYTKDIEKDGNVQSVKTLTVDIANADGKKIAIISYPDADYSGKTNLQGVLVKTPTVIYADIAAKLSEGEQFQISEYALDTRNIEMNSETSDIIFFILLMIVLIYLIIKTILYYVNPLITPTIRQLKKYGDLNDVIADIEHQLTSDVISTDRHKIYTGDWVLIQSTFTLKVEKNPASGGKFKYIPNI